MRCRCGAIFIWSEAPLVATPGCRCHQVHEGSGISQWGAVCEHATWIAVTRLAIRRTAVVAFAVAGAVCCAAVAMVALAVTTVSWVVIIALDRLCRLLDFRSCVPSFSSLAQLAGCTAVLAFAAPGTMIGTTRSTVILSIAVVLIAVTSIAIILRRLLRIILSCNC